MLPLGPSWRGNLTQQDIDDFHNQERAHTERDYPAPPVAVGPALPPTYNVNPNQYSAPVGGPAGGSIHPQRPMLNLGITAADLDPTGEGRRNAMRQALRAAVPVGVPAPPSPGLGSAPANTSPQFIPGGASDYYRSPEEQAAYSQRYSENLANGSGVRGSMEDPYYKQSREIVNYGQAPQAPSLGSMQDRYSTQQSMVEAYSRNGGQPVDARYAANPSGRLVAGGQFVRPDQGAYDPVAGWRQGIAPSNEQMLAADQSRRTPSRSGVYGEGPYRGAAVQDDGGAAMGVAGDFRGMPVQPGAGLSMMSRHNIGTSEEMAARRKQHQIEISQEQEARMLARMGRGPAAAAARAFGNIPPAGMEDLVNGVTPLRQSMIDRQFDRQQEESLEAAVTQKTGIKNPTTQEDFLALNEAAASEIFDQWSSDALSTERALQLAKNADGKSPTGMRTVEKRLREQMDQWGQQNTKNRELKEGADENFKFSVPSFMAPDRRSETALRSWTLRNQRQRKQPATP
jgi:hypothetical protein